ncbi:hypothetical protein MUCCIDRAFT_115581 [Mucor lusitanicus CBS 277.49]|uniref:Anaphase-promoting complex subunit 4 n=1 Tax=Mucor lusitanicus CBS 277.49 TaxID=747725 RepID=A0A168GVE6_MUCCL|nr:hypothetical protein MUCCIDRAFT_115581 [Mucor lusitanicus CBS 277.49]
MSEKEEEEAIADTSFSFSEQNLLIDDVKLISWCPTTDLVLLVSPTNTLSLYRSGITITRVWSIQHQVENNVNVVAWKPNGKEFVLGCDNGAVYKVDITYPTPAITPCWTPANSGHIPILSLVWINYEFKKKQMDIDGFDIHAFDLEAALPTLSEESPEEPLSRMPMFKPKKIRLPVKPQKQSEMQSLLFAGDAKGHIQVILNGIYPIGSAALTMDPYAKVELDALEISAAHNMASLQVMTKPRSNAPEFVSYTLDTQILDDRKEEIHSISQVQTQLNYLLQYTKSTLDVVKRHHDAYSGFTMAIARQAANYITNHNEDTSAMPEVELFATLATGNVTESLQEFFTEYLTSQRIKQWESNVKHGYHNSLVIICEHILPACERIQMQLCTLLGYSLWKQRYGDFLKSEAVENCIDKTRKLISEAFNYSKALGSLIKSFEAFSKWITIVSQKIYDPDSVEFEHQTNLCEDPELVADFLENNFVQDALDIYFSQRDKNLTLLLSDLSETCIEMLKRPSEIVSAKMQVVATCKVRMHGVSIQAQPRQKLVSHTAMEDGHQTIYYAVLQTKPDTQLMILKRTFDDAPLKYVAFNVDGDITDFEFFDNKEIGVLTQTNDETTMLRAISLTDANFQSLTHVKLNTSNAPSMRSQELDNMIQVKLGCNGAPRRRVLSVVGSNGMLKVYYMDSSEEDSSGSSSSDEEMEESV